MRFRTTFSEGVYEVFLKLVCFRISVASVAFCCIETLFLTGKELSLLEAGTFHGTFGPFLLMRLFEHGRCGAYVD